MKAHLVSAVDDVLQQGTLLLRSLTSNAYTRKEDGPYGSSLGTHYRHVLDHFSCLLEGISSGEIDYDRRRRSPELENSIDAALLMTEILKESFQRMPADLPERSCTVIYSVTYGDSQAQAVNSNFAREIMFCVGHAIHHFAILKLLCAGRSVPLPYEFGVAPSTLKHLESEAVHQG